MYQALPLVPATTAAALATTPVLRAREIAIGTRSVGEISCAEMTTVKGTVSMTQMIAVFQLE